MSPMSRSFVAKLEGFAAQHEIPLVQFRKGQRKDTVMAEHRNRHQPPTSRAHVFRGILAMVR
jgi:hypothetical protein